MKGVVPAAGRGTRLGWLTDDQPKGLVEVNETPLLEYALAAAVDAGVEELVVIIGYEGEQIIDRFGDTYDDVPITYVRQREQLGLGHAVLQAAPHIDAQFLVLNGDNVFAESLGAVVTAAGQSEIDGALTIEKVSSDVARTTGVLEFAEGNVAGIVEKPDDPPSGLVTTGCYVLPPDIFHACRLLRPSAEGEYQLSEAVGLLIDAGYSFETVSITDRVNVNTPRDIERAEALLP